MKMKQMASIIFATILVFSTWGITAQAASTYKVKSARIYDFKKRFQ